MHHLLRIRRVAFALGIAWVAFCLDAAAATSLSPWMYRAWQTQHGLPDLSISGLAQTEDGYLWVATKGGLVCFNGQQFSLVPRANFPDLPSRAVRAMFRDHRDHLWLGMERGPLLCLKPDGLQSFTAEDDLPSQRVVMMTEDSQGAVWVVYPTQLRRITNGRVEAIALPNNWRDPGDLIAARDARGNIWCARGRSFGVWREGQWQSKLNLRESITSLGSGSNSNLWIGSGGRLFDFEEGRKPVELGSLPKRTSPTVIVEDRSGALWVATASEGLFRWQDQAFERVATSQQEITCLFEDREGNILVGTAGGGLNLIRPRTVALIGREAGLPTESVLSVSEDSEGSLWAATQDGQLVRHQNGNWEVMSTATNWPGGRVTCVAADAQRGVWVGTGDRGLKFYHEGVWREWLQPDGLIADGVRSLLVGSEGEIWVASMSVNRLQCLRNGHFVNITNATRLGPIRALAQGSDGTVWIGTAEGEVRRVRNLTLVNEPAIAEPVPLSVRSLLATADGSLWIGYAGDGLGHFKDSQYHRLTSEAGLPDDFVSQLLADDGGNFWIAGNRGLSRVSHAELQASISGHLQRISGRAYSSADDVPGIQPSRDYWPSAWRGKDGRLWFAMRSGLLEVQPDKLRDNPNPPLVTLEKVAVDDQLVAIYNAGSPLQTQTGSNVINLRSISKPLRLGPEHRKLEIEFAALSFTSPENVQYRYQLSGFDPEWVEVGPKHSARYPRLPAGEYQFRVLACNNTGVWNQTGATLMLSVAPFFWETWWFRLCGAMLTILFGGGCALIISRRRYRQKLRRLEARQALEQERARIARDIHDDLGSSLTRISLLSQPARNDPDDTEAAAANLVQIHQTARDLTHAMGEVVWAVNPEHDTFDSLANYISNYAQNFLRTARVRCRLEMPVQLPQRPLSSGLRHNLLLAFKEALNNVVRHSGASEVRITLTTGDTGFELVVADNGKGFVANGARPQTEGGGASRSIPGNGLKNMRSRLAEIGGDCELETAPGAGTKITFRVKLKTAYGPR